MRSILASFVVLWAMCNSAPVVADDGHLEINQVCAVNAGCFPGDAAGFPVTISGSAGSSYRLSSDLQVPDADTTAIEVTTGYVTVDLGGFKIQGVTSCSGSPITCAPAGSGIGVEVAVAGSNFGVRVMNGTVAGMGNTGIRISAYGTVENIHATQNGNRGIHGAGPTVIRNNVADLNMNSGIYTLYPSEITDNLSKSNGLNGIRGGGTVRGNTVHFNSGDGIFVVGASSIFDNTVIENGLDGIDATGGGRSYVKGNTVAENHGIGLNLVDGNRPDAVYRDNLVHDNLGGTVAGGGERGGNTCRDLMGAFTDCP